MRCTFHQNHTLSLYQLWLCLHLWSTGGVWWIGSCRRNEANPSTRDQCCCSLWQVACDSLPAVTATVSAIARCSAKTLRKAKLLPFPFLPAKVYTFEMIYIFLWYQFLTSLVMRSHSKPVEVRRCLSALVRSYHAHAGILGILAEPFNLWGYCWVVLL